MTQENYISMRVNFHKHANSAYSVSFFIRVLMNFYKLGEFFRPRAYDFL
jgi:hypothetical protein